jgi:hypothetical protein
MVGIRKGRNHVLTGCRGESGGVRVLPASTFASRSAWVDFPGSMMRCERRYVIRRELDDGMVRIEANLFADDGDPVNYSWVIDDLVRADGLT